MAAVRSLDHVTIVTENVEETAAFFEDVLGLVNRPDLRPDFGFPGAWLFVGDQAVVHLIYSEKDRGTPAGPFDHAAFATDDFDGVLEHIESLGIDHRVAEQPRTGLGQIFLHEPNGVEIEITCPA